MVIITNAIIKLNASGTVAMSNELNDEVKDIWNANAAFWGKCMGEGNDFHRLLIEPNQLD